MGFKEAFSRKGTVKTVDMTGNMEFAKWLNENITSDTIEPRFEAVSVCNLEVTYSMVLNLLDFANAYISKYGYDKIPYEKKSLIALLLELDNAFLEEDE